MDLPLLLEWEGKAVLALCGCSSTITRASEGSPLPAMQQRRLCSLGGPCQDRCCICDTCNFPGWVHFSVTTQWLGSEEQSQILIHILLLWLKWWPYPFTMLMNSPQRTACLAKVNAKGPFFFTYIKCKFSNDGNWTPYMRHLSDSNLYSGVELQPWTFQWDLTLYLLLWTVLHINRSVHQWSIKCT